MFVVTTESGKVFIEGRDVPYWDAIPKEERIYSVMLTDGEKIQHTLEGFDFYVCCYESTLSLACGNGNAKQIDHYQKLYGIRNLERHYHDIFGLYEAFISEVRKNFIDAFPTNNALMVQIQKDQELKFRENLQKFIDSLKNTEVVLATLGITLATIRKDQCDQDSKCWKAGIGNHDSFDSATIRNHFISG